jgi:pyridoxal phosphate enzyme (YggS family)
MSAEIIKANVAEIRSRIAAACSRSGRAAGEVTLVGVSKTFPAAAVDQGVAAGITDIGENRVQEVRDKIGDVASSPRWHLIGHLQSNKAKDAVQLFDVIQTVDSSALAGRLDSAARAAGKRLEVLLQVNIAGEAQKSGIGVDEADRLAADTSKLANIELTGLMTMPPIGSPEESRRWFAALRELRDRLQKSHPSVAKLSMGMSADFEVAIEEGSTMVRVGRAIFGSRG